MTDESPQPSQQKPENEIIQEKRVEDSLVSWNESHDIHGRSQGF